MLYLCLTFDYELFLGKNNDTYEEILFAPTEKLARTMTEGGASGTFFADVPSALVHLQLGDKAYYERFTQQIKDLIAQKHDVQLHLHTNWYYAEKAKNKLEIPPKGYRIHEFGFDASKDMSVHKIVSETKSYLETALRQVDPDYRCIAYRAGGFGIQPEQELLQVLRNNGIMIDSSVVPRMKSNGINHYDFSHVPKNLNWYVDPDKGLLDASVYSDRNIFEVPVLTLRPRLREYIGKTSSQLRLPASIPKGEYAHTNSRNPKNPSVLRKICGRLFNYRYISLDTRYYERIVDDLNYVYKKHSLDKEEAYICLICHPKLADSNRIENIRKLIAAVNKKPKQMEFITFAEIYKRVFALK